MDELLNNFFNIPIFIQVAPFLLQGLLNTLLPDFCHLVRKFEV
jgi:hypothetical protein